MTDTLAREQAPGPTKKPKTMQAGSPGEFQTDPAALQPLLDFLPREWVIWECACGEGNLVRGFRAAGREVIGTDLLTGHDFLTWQPERFDVVVTNPPFNGDLKERFLQRAYDLGKPFAFLLPLTVFDSRKRQALFRQHGLQVLFLPRRVVFTTPNGKTGGAWFMCAWITWGLDLPRDLVFWQPERIPQGSLLSPATAPGREGAAR